MTTLGTTPPPRTAPAAAPSWPEARATAAAAAGPLAVRDIPLRRAHGRALARPLTARAPLPAFDTAAMDGYAVAGPGPWTVAGRVLAGQEPPVARLAAGRALEVATGARVPAGTGAVLPYEDALRTGASVAGAVRPGRHVRRRGEECPAGAEVLPPGAVLTPAALGLAASLGYDRVAVHRRPRVALLVTGDELVRRGTPPPGRVRDAVGPLLPGVVAWAGGAAQPVTYLPDGRPPLAAALTRAAAGADAVAVCGASSRGPADHLRPALADLGADVLVDGVACRPGHPQLLARLPGGGPPVVGLPGNPYAAFAACLTLLVPLLERLAGRTPPPPWRARLAPAPDAARAARRAPARHPRDTRLVPVALDGTRAVPVGHDRPGLLWGAAAADAVAVLPPGGAPESASDVEVEVEVELLRLPR